MSWFVEEKTDEIKIIKSKKLKSVFSSIEEEGEFVTIELNEKSMPQIVAFEEEKEKEEEKE